jgi:cytoskeleton protein RodZ
MTMTLDTEPTHAAQPEPLTPSAGTLLRGYRETLGIQAEALAKKLHVPLNKLQALEQDRLDALPDAMFARALALAICRQLHTDAAPVLARLPSPDVTRLAHHNERGLDFPLKRPSLLPASGLGALRELPRWQWAVIAALTLAAVFMASPWDNGNASHPTDSTGSSAQVVVPLQTVTLPGTPANVPTMPAATGNAVQPNATELAPVVPPMATPPSGKLVVTPLQHNAVVLTPVTPAVPTTASEGAGK